MSSSVHSSPSQPGAPAPVKHLYLVPGAGEVEYVPRLYFEVKIDLSDIRSGFIDTCSVNAALEIYPLEAADSIWTRDMALAVDPARVASARPPALSLAPLPPYVDAEYLRRTETLFLSFLIRYYAVPVFRNFALKVYSSPSETAADFKSRCLDLSSESFRKDLDELHQTFVRKLEQLRQKYLTGGVVPLAGKDFDTAKLDSLLHNQMHQVSERIADLFIQTELTLEGELADLPPGRTPSMELEARLVNIEAEARQDIRRLVSQYRDRVQTIDDYTVRPNLKDLHMVRSCILWMPRPHPADSQPDHSSVNPVVLR
jgi:hypothetical protein